MCDEGSTRVLGGIERNLHSQGLKPLYHVLRNGTHAHLEVVAICKSCERCRHTLTRGEQQGGTRAGGASSR